MTDTSIPCRSCGDNNLKSILSLGKTPLANSLLTAKQLDEPEPVYPLVLAFCPKCALVQITETVPPEMLFRDYLYFSSFSDTMLNHAKTLADRLVRERHLSSTSQVTEIASNDGYLLQYYAQQDIPVLGIEPAVNIADVARKERGIKTLCEFFGTDLARQLKAEGSQADIVHAHNVLAHVSDLHGFVNGLRLLLKDNGIAVIEVPYVKDMIDKCEFDTIYHEHLCYFSLTALDWLFKQHGLSIYDVERVSIHGGSLRLFAAKSELTTQRESVEKLLKEETAWGVSELDFYQNFASQVQDLKTSLLDLLHNLKQEGKSIAGYGAAAKGSTLLNFIGAGSDILDFIADRSVYKQGRYMPGVHLPVDHPNKLLEIMPDYTLILPWNLADEIIEQQAKYQEQGGKFIIPIPNPMVVE